MIFLFAVGLVSILGQAAILRELSVAFYGVDLIYALALGVWLIWSALGAMIGRRKLKPSNTWIPWLFLAFSILLVSDVVFIRSIRTLFSGVPGAYLPFVNQVLSMSAALLPLGVLSGLLFQLAAKVYLGAGRTLAVAYAIECVGGLAGGLGATLFLKWGIQNLTIAIVCALLAVGAAMSGRCSGRSLRIALASIGLVLLGLFLRSSPVDRALTSWTHPELITSTDTPYCRITVTRWGNQIAVYENDALSFETEGTDAEEFVQMAALQHPRPERVLILGGGVEGTVGEMLKHGPARVDYVELNPALLNVAQANLPAGLRKPLYATQVHIFVADPRRFLDASARYDLILVGMPEPESGQANRFYTLEFFKQCAAHLNPEGVLAFRLKSSENFWTPQQAGRAASIYQALKAALPQVLVLPGGTNVFLASRQTLQTNPAILTDRFEARRISARLVSPPYIRYVYGNDRFAQVAHTLETENVPINTDVRPVCYQYTLMIWLSKFYPRLASFDLSSLAAGDGPRSVLLWGTMLTGVALLLVCRRWAALRRALMVGIAGSVGMILETVLVLHYQVRSGILFQDIGVLLMSFMAGLALGALATDRWIFARLGKFPVWYGPLLVGFAVLVSLVAAERIGSDAMTGLTETTGFLLATGFLVAAMFAYASLEGACDQRELVSPLSAADLLGGCLGTLAASLLLIPIAGMAASAILVSPLALSCALLLRWKQ